MCFITRKKNDMIVLVILFLFYFSTYDCYSRWNLLRQKTELNLNETFFPHLKNYQVNARTASEDDFPWIARVIHARKNFAPHLCTAICIEKKIFISSARCVHHLKIFYTTILYHKKRLTVKAFVLPTKESKQLYDDIGFIIVNGYSGTWNKIETFDKKRPDNVFQWFKHLEFVDYEYKVVGYAATKESIIQNKFIWKRAYELTQLDVVVDIKLCRDILPYNHLIVGFEVPCYHSCTFKDQENYEVQCDNYHGVDGGALVNSKTMKLFGVATWAAYFEDFELPVGFAIPNSNSYFEDYACALKIRDNKEHNVTKGYYQKLCDTKRKHFDNNENKYDYYTDVNNTQNFLY